MRVFLVVFASFFLTQPADAQTLIVGNKAEHTVSFVDLATGQEVVRRETGRYPHEIAVSPDGEQAVVVSYRGRDFTGETLHRFDIEKAEPLGPVSLGDSRGPHGLKWVPNTDMVIVTTEVTKDTVLIDPSRGRIRDVIATDQDGSHMVAVAPDGLRAYVANIGSGTFSVIDIPRAEKIRDVKAGTQTEAIAVTPDGEDIIVGNNGSKSVMIFDAETFELKDSFETEGVPIRIEISPDGKTIAVSQYDRGEVVFYRRRNLKKIGTVELGEGSDPVTLLFSPDGKRLWAAATGTAQVVEVDTRRRREIRRFDVGQGSDGLGYSPLTVSVED